MGADDSLPDDVTTLQAMLRAERTARLAAEAEAQAGTLLIEKLKLTIKKLRHEQFGQSSERGALLDQLELQLADLEENAAQAETAAQTAAEKIAVPSFQRRKPARRPLPEHLPRERIAYPMPATCPCCGDNRLRKLGEDVTEMLEFVPRQWKVIQHVREKFICRACEAITQPPAPSHPIARGRAGPKLLAHILFAKYGLHLPLNRQSDVYQREGVDLDVSTLADWVGASAATLMPLVDAIRSHVFAAERIHATVPVLAKGKTRTGRLWTYVRDDRPFAGPDPPAAVFFYSPDRGGAHPEQHLAGYAGLMQADAYAGFGRLYEVNRKGGPIIEAACWAPTRAAAVRPRSTPSSLPPSSTTSIRRPGSPTCSPACRIIPPRASTNSWLGTGALRTSLTPPECYRLPAQSDPARGRRRMRTVNRTSARSKWSPFRSAPAELDEGCLRLLSAPTIQQARCLSGPIRNGRL
jgi:transposase